MSLILVWENGIAVVREAGPSELPEPVVSPSEEQLLLSRRQRMVVYRKAFRKALSQQPAPTELHANLLVAVDAYVSTLTPYDELRETWNNVVIFERLHPDIELLKTGLAFTDTQMDNLFALAVYIETGVQI